MYPMKDDHLDSEIDWGIEEDMRRAEHQMIIEEEIMMSLVEKEMVDVEPPPHKDDF